MKCTRLKTGIFWNRRSKISGLELDGSDTINRYPFGVTLFGKYKKASYGRYGNTPLPEKMKYNTQFCDDPNIQYFMWGDSSGVEVRKQQRIRIGWSTR